MEWLKSCFRNPEFSGKGCLIRLSDPNDNYTKKTEFMNATLIVKNKELYVKNDDFDSEQEQIDYISFPLTADCQLIHYTISDDDVKIECIKWVNLNSKGSHDSYFGFEFEDPATFVRFSIYINKYVSLDEEGYQDPSLRTKNVRLANEQFKVSMANTKSDIYKNQLKPEIDNEEETKARSALVFKRDAIISLSHLYSPDTILFVSAGDLYILGPGLKAPILADKGVGFLIIKHPAFKVSLDIVRDSQIVMRILIDNDFYCSVDSELKKVFWVEPVTETERRTWRADLVESVDSLETIINIAKFESEKKIEISELNEEDQKWIRGDHESSSEISDIQDRMELDLDVPLPQMQDEDMDEINDTSLGWRSSKVFASRKGKICLYSNSDQTITKDSVIRLDKNPTSMILQNNDTNLLFLTKEFPNVVYRFDIERGTIVDEFSVKDKAFIQLCHENKLSSLTDSQLFLGLCEKSMYTFDPRTSNKIVKEFSYSTNTGFSCMATTEEGYAAVASNKGDIRLYKEIGKKSTTNFPGLGPGIKSVDVSKNGAWLLATTSTYLMVIQTKFQNELAYTKALARKRKPAKKLSITPEDISQFNILKIDFSPAKFNVSETGEENSIITSTGDLVVVWNFISVKSGMLNDYCIMRLEERVIKNEFKFGEENAVITYPKSITVQNSRWNPKRK